MSHNVFSRNSEWYKGLKIEMGFGIKLKNFAALADCVTPTSYLTPRKDVFITMMHVYLTL